MKRANKANFENITSHTVIIKTFPEYMLAPGGIMEMPICKITMDLVEKNMLKIIRMRTYSQWRNQLRFGRKTECDMRWSGTMPSYPTPETKWDHVKAKIYYLTLPFQFVLVFVTLLTVGLFGLFDKGDK